MVKHSRKRDAVLEQLSGRTDHPTAETIYRELKEKMPDISLATVYRNLNQLAAWGEIQAITSEGPTRFDPNARPHSHFFCERCGRVMDLDDDNDQILKMGQKRFNGIIKGCASNYYGLCPECAAAEKKAAN